MAIPGGITESRAPQTTKTMNAIDKNLNLFLISPVACLALIANPIPSNIKVEIRKNIIIQ